MTENTLKTIFSFISVIMNVVVILYIVILTYFFTIFSNEEMIILIMIISPLITVYIPIFVKHITNERYIKTDKSKKIATSSAVFFILIFFLLMTSILGSIYLKSTGHIPNFITLVSLIGSIEIFLGVGIGVIIQSLYLK